MISFHVRQRRVWRKTSTAIWEMTCVCEKNHDERAHNFITVNKKAQNKKRDIIQMNKW